MICIRKQVHLTGQRIWKVCQRSVGQRWTAASRGNGQLHIVLLILKILGILLLVLLGLLLLVLLAVLFVPVRYQLQGMWKEDKWASVKVSWLLSVISFKGAYEMEKGLTGSLRVLWFKLWTMGDESAEKIEEAEETAEKTVKKSGRKSSNCGL